MSLDPVGLARSSSPASSEASLSRNPSRANEDGLKKDKGYRRYAANVERALSLFDTALQEWADYISFLSRLLKALQSHPPSLSVVPNKSVVAKRLAQCLNPSLPSGVHQKALEVYNYIFALLKPDGLARDLTLYFPGIAPTLSFASLSVRPLFLSLLEAYVVPLGSKTLRPALKAIILSLLPGLEEETSDDFETTLRIVNQLRDISSGRNENGCGAESHTSSQYFWQCLFLASITNPTRRMGVLAYLNRHLPQLGGNVPWTALLSHPSSSESVGLSDSITSLTSPEPGLLIRCFATGLADDQLLVQRNFLDLLVTHLPLHSPVLQTRITRNDLQLLVAAAAGVVIRRDMSLNRRLWAWFLGPDLSNDAHESGDLDGQSVTSEPSANHMNQNIPKAQYFASFGMKPLVQSIRAMIARDSPIPQERAKPFRISLSLMDRWEVGGLIVPAVFLPIMRSVWRYSRLATSNGKSDEVFRSASAFFDGVESSLIFSELLSLILPRSGDIGTVSDRTAEDLRLANFIVSNFNIKEEEMVTMHAPLLLLGLLLMMERVSSSEPENLELSKRTFDEMSIIAQQLSGLIPARALTSKDLANPDINPIHVEDMTAGEIMSQLHTFYGRTKDSLDVPEPPFSPDVSAELILSQTHSLVLLAMMSEQQQFGLKKQVNLLISLLKKAPRSEVLRQGELYHMMHQKLSAAQNGAYSLPMGTLSAMCSAITSLYPLHDTGFYITYKQVCEATPLLVRQLWALQSPSSPKYHVEAVRCLWLLHSVSWQDHLVEAAITSSMFTSDQSKVLHQITLDQAERFFVFWGHSHQAKNVLLASRTIGLDQRDAQSIYQGSLLDRPLFLVLDLLSSNLDRSSTAVKHWLQDLSSVHQIFGKIIAKLSQFNYFKPINSHATSLGETIAPDDANQCCYLFKTIFNIIGTLNSTGWSLLTSNTIPNSSSQALPEHEVPLEDSSIQATIMQFCLQILKRDRPSSIRKFQAQEQRLEEVVLGVLRQLLSGPGAVNLVGLHPDIILVDRLSACLDSDEIALQGLIMDALLPALKNRIAHDTTEYLAQVPKHQRKSSTDTLSNISRLSVSIERPEKGIPGAQIHPSPSPQLLPCILKGIRSKSSRPIIEKWVEFLAECLPFFFESIFQVLLTLVENLCKEVKASHDELRAMFQSAAPTPHDRSDHVTVALLGALETCIGAAHDQLLLEESRIPAAKIPDHPQGFFGNMVSGVFASEGNQARSATGNDRLTVLLCFQDTVRLCYSIWAWGDGGRNRHERHPECNASFQYTSLRMRNRTRRILEHLFAAEALECLETLIQLWCSSIMAEEHISSKSIFNLLHTLDGSRPKIAVPAIFNAIYSRTNPAALEPNRKSAMTSRLSEAELAAFLVMYARSLDEDVLDEIWTDCTTFLRDVLSNPFPHRHILPRLLEFAAILGEKMEHTTFGDDARARKDLGDLLLRLLTAICTSKPLGFTQESSLTASQPSQDTERRGSSLSKQETIGPDDIHSILVSTMPALTTTLGETDRISSTMSNISLNLVSPLLHSKLFPQNINHRVLELLQQMSRIPAASRYWKKDVGDAFNDPKFFGTEVTLAKSNWLSLIRQWALTDKERLPDLLSRLTQPASAGIMFGVGATAARLEADRKAQLNLRRISLLILASDTDHLSNELMNLERKLEDLLTATHISSPSSATRAEIYMVLRALVLKTSAVHIAPFWPMVSSELREVISAVIPGRQSETYNPYSLLQACKLLETLLLTCPDDFQLQEWLFVTDTIDIIYPPDRWESMALADGIARALGTGSTDVGGHLHDSGDHDEGLKRLWLGVDQSRETAKDEIVDKLLRPFFGRLSIHAFESTYSLGAPDWEACKDDLLADLFNEFTVVS